MAKAYFTDEAARRVVAAALAVEGMVRDQGGVETRYRGDDADDTRFLRLTLPLANCGVAKGVLVELMSSGAGGDGSCPDFEATDQQAAAMPIRDIGSVVRAFRVSMKERPDLPIEPGAVVECDYRQPAEEGEDPFWRVVRVVRCDCGSGSGSGSDSSAGEVEVDVIVDARLDASGLVLVRRTVRVLEVVEPDPPDVVIPVTQCPPGGSGSA